MIHTAAVTETEDRKDVMRHTHRARTAIARSAVACVLATAALGLAAPALADEAGDSATPAPVTAVDTGVADIEPASDARAADDVDEAPETSPAEPTQPEPAQPTEPTQPEPEQPAESTTEPTQPDLPEQPADPADPADWDQEDAGKDGATPTPAPTNPSDSAITPPDPGGTNPDDPLGSLPVVQLDNDQVTPTPATESTPTVEARPSTPPSEDADRTSVTCEISGTTSVSPDPACRAVDLVDAGASAPAGKVERVKVVSWAAGDVQPKLTFEPATEVAGVTGIKLTLVAPSRSSNIAAPSEVRVTVLDEAGNATAFEVPTPSLAQSDGRPQTFVVKFDTADTSPQLAEGRISRAGIGGASVRTGTQAIETGAVVVATEFLAAPTTPPVTPPAEPPVAPPAGQPAPGAAPTTPVVPTTPAAPQQNPANRAATPAPANRAPSLSQGRPEAAPLSTADALPLPGTTEEPGVSEGSTNGPGDDAAQPAQEPAEQRLDAVPFGPAALPPNLVTLLQTTGITLAILGSMALITAEERRRRRLG